MADEERLEAVLLKTGDWDVYRVRRELRRTILGSETAVSWRSPWAKLLSGQDGKWVVARPRFTAQGQWLWAIDETRQFETHLEALEAVGTPRPSEA